MFVIEGKVALITGGASGIGLCYAKELLRNGLKGVTLADINEEFGKVAVQQLEEEFKKPCVLFVKTDVTNAEEFEEAFKQTINCFKNIDILINNAGILNDSVWEKEILLNINATVRGTMLGIDNYLPKYKSGSEAVIVNVSSVAGYQKVPFFPVYTATKHAVLALSACFGAEAHYNRTKVKVLTICPGATETPLMDFSTEKTLGSEYNKLAHVGVKMIKTLQTPESVAKGMVEIIKIGKSGSAWCVEDYKPPYEVEVFSEKKDRLK